MAFSNFFFQGLILSMTYLPVAGKARCQATHFHPTEQVIVFTFSWNNVIETNVMKLESLPHPTSLSLLFYLMQQTGFGINIESLMVQITDPLSILLRILSTLKRIETGCFIEIIHLLSHCHSHSQSQSCWTMHQQSITLINREKAIGITLKIAHFIGCEMPSSQHLDVI